MSIEEADIAFKVCEGIGLCGGVSANLAELDETDLFEHVEVTGRGTDYRRKGAAKGQKGR
jgi:hypothetical protein